MKYIIAIITVLSLGLSQELRAQFIDSLQLKVGTIGTVATNDYQPTWLVSQRWGTISDQQADLSSHITFSNKHVLGGNDPFKSYLRNYRNHPETSISYGLDLYNNQLFGNNFLQQAYVKFKLNHWQLAVGRFESVVGEVDPQLSSGSFGISGNALPIPKISISVEDYTDFPFLPAATLQFKGELSHGMMGDDAYVKNANYHQRSLYFQFGKRTFKTFMLYGGLNQFVTWGGEHPERGQLPGTFADLAKIIVPGNNLGFFDYGFTLLTRDFKLKAYTQVPFEGRGNINPFRVKDRLAGIILSDKRKNSLFPTITFELINTTWQDTNPENLTRQDDYNFYNNSIYKDGWSYQQRILGTPLFFDRKRAISYFGESYNNNLNQDWNIANNRLNGVHIGLKGNVPITDLSYRTLFTYTINHGNYYNGAAYQGLNKSQIYFMQEVSYQIEALSFIAAIGADVGGLTKNVGTLLGIEYDINYNAHPRQVRPTQYRRLRRPYRRF